MKTLYVVVVFLVLCMPVTHGEVVFNVAPVAGETFSIKPESERSLRRVVIGLEPNQPDYNMIASVQNLPMDETDSRIRFVRREIARLRTVIHQHERGLIKEA